MESEGDPGVVGSEPKQDRLLAIVYCDVCGVPPEYCCYGSKWELCKEWITTNYEFESEERKNILLKDWENIFQTENKSKQKTGEDDGSEEVVHYVTIDVKNRGKNRFVTEIHGLSNYLTDSGDMKTVCSKIKKKFACSAIVTGSSMKGRKGERNTKKQDKWQAREDDMQKRKLKKNGIIPKDDDATDTTNDKQQKPKKPPKSQVEEFIEAQGDVSFGLAQFFVKEFKIPEDCIKKTDENKK
jgi:translation initiation factor 1 (eIF-1/SUI1)